MNNYECFLPIIDKDFLSDDYNINSTYEYNNIKVPRVTEILKLFGDKEALMMWSNSLGFRRQKYRDTLELAANRGTIIHNCIERYILHNEVPDFSIYENEISVPLYNAFYGFKEWWETFTTKNDVKVIEVEKTLVCPYYGGTLDLLINVNGKNYIYDFKTSKEVQYKYFVQLSAYKYAIENYYGISIDGGLAVLKLNKFKKDCTEYLLSFSIQNNVLYYQYCIELFMSLLYTYYNNCRAVKFFKSTALRIK